MKREYDFVFSLGYSCGTSQALRTAGLQFASFPLDWVGVHDINASVRAIEEEFAHWMDSDDMQLVDVRHGVGFLTRAYLNTRTQMGFSHEFSDFKTFDSVVARVRESYARRAVRFLEEIRVAKRILAVWAEPPMITEPDESAYRDALARLRKKCPEAEVSLLTFVERPGCDEPTAVLDDDGLIVVVADYRKMEGGALTHFVDFSQFVHYLKPRFSAVDRRTDEERRKYNDLSHQMSSLRWGPDKSTFRRWLNQRAYKVFRSLERYLQKRGLIHSEGPFWFYEDTRRLAKEVHA